VSIYYCDRCDGYKDADESPCMDLFTFTQKPGDGTRFICNECALEIEEEAG